MARKLIAVFAAVATGAFIIWYSGEETVQVDSTGEKPTPLVSAQPSTHPALVDEIDVPWTRHASSLVDCPDAETGKSEEKFLAEIEAQQQQMLRVLGSSADAEHLMVAALVSWIDDADSALVLLGDAGVRAPGNPMVASQSLALCLEIGHCRRARPEMEQNLIAADKGNVLAWIQVARSRLSRDDEQGALSALREAAAAAVVEDYFTDYVLAFERALAASSDLPAHERMSAAFGHAAAVFSGSYLLISADCQSRASISAEWADVCIRLGERLESDGRTFLTAGIGIGIQARMYELLQDWREHERTLNRQRAFRDRYQPLIQTAEQAEKLEDATVFRKYLEIFDSGGELEAMQYIAEEVETRLPQDCQTP